MKKIYTHTFHDYTKIIDNELYYYTSDTLDVYNVGETIHIDYLKKTESNNDGYFAIGTEKGRHRYKIISIHKSYQIHIFEDGDEEMWFHTHVYCIKDV